MMDAGSPKNGTLVYLPVPKTDFGELIRFSCRQAMPGCMLRMI
jgi:hypothetical protein